MIGQRGEDVAIKTDPEMSGEHALILCRQGQYHLIDQSSTNGTFLEGNMITPQSAVELPHQARVKVGGTVFQFMRIEGHSTSTAPTGRAYGAGMDPDDPPDNGPTRFGPVGR